MLPHVMMAYRSTVSESTGFTPYRLVFGKEMRLGVDLGTPMPEPSMTVRSWAVRLLENLERAYAQARENLHRVHLRSSDLYDTGVVRHHYLPGSWVRQQIVRVAPSRGVATKFLPKFSMPLQVIRTNGPLVLTFEPDSEKTVWMHHDSLRKSNLAPCPIPEKFVRISKDNVQLPNERDRKFIENSNEFSMIKRSSNEPATEVEVEGESSNRSYDLDEGGKPKDSYESGLLTSRDSERLIDSKESIEIGVSQSGAESEREVCLEKDSNESLLDNQTSQGANSKEKPRISRTLVIDTDDKLHEPLHVRIRESVPTHTEKGVQENKFESYDSNIKSRFGRRIISSNKSDFIYFPETENIASVFAYYTDPRIDLSWSSSNPVP